MIVRNLHATANRQSRRRATVPMPGEDEVEEADGLTSPEPGPERLSILRDEARAAQAVGSVNEKCAPPPVRRAA